MICADRQAGDPVIAGDAAAGAGHLVVPGDGGTAGAGDEAAAPARFSHARRSVDWPSVRPLRAYRRLGARGQAVAA